MLNSSSGHRIFAFEFLRMLASKFASLNTCFTPLLADVGEVVPVDPLLPGLLV